MRAGGKMDQRKAIRVFLDLAWLLGILLLGPAGFAQAGPAGKTRIYYVAADEVTWNYRAGGPG